MNFRILLSLVALLLALPSYAGAPNADLERRFDAAIDPRELDAWMKLMASAPNHVGSPHDKANAEWQLAQFRNFGWDARMETYDVLYPTPIEERLELLGPTPHVATLTESAITGDSTSNQTAAELPAYVAYQGDGDVTAPLVYVNYGMPEDYRQLTRMGISVKGKIVIARYGAGWRGLKPKLAQEHGALGCIIYSDPADDGYGHGDVYPDGPTRPVNAFQRGSVADMPLYPGDPLTPGTPSNARAKRLARSEAKSILRIPTLPISYGDAQHFLKALGGRTAPAGWRGGLAITYHIGGTDQVRAHILVKSDWSAKTIYNVVARIEGSTWPDQWILRGNHHDGWVFGASDPLSGQVALMAEAKAIGGLVATGWRPKRTLVYLSWDAEEPGLIGSTEWAEDHEAELRKKALIYINSDGNGRGLFQAGGSSSFQHFVNEVAGDVVDPETGVSVAKRLRSAIEVAALKGGSADLKGHAKLISDPAHDMLLEPLGSGSDFTPFLQHVGMASLNIGFGGEGDSDGVYHSAYDSYDHHRRFVDPGFVYDALLARTAGRLVLRLADAEMPVQRYADFAEAIGLYLDEVKKLAYARREAASQQTRLLTNDAFRLADDPTFGRADPDPLPAVPHFNFAPMDNALERLKESAGKFDKALAARQTDLPATAKAALFDVTREAELALLDDVGLPFRPWFRNLVYAPGRYTGYGAKTLPGIREAIEEDRFADVDLYSELTAKALNRYADKLTAGLRLLEGR